MYLQCDRLIHLRLLCRISFDFPRGRSMGNFAFSGIAIITLWRRKRKSRDDPLETVSDSRGSGRPCFKGTLVPADPWPRGAKVPSRIVCVGNVTNIRIRGRSGHLGATRASCCSREKGGESSTRRIVKIMPLALSGAGMDPALTPPFPRVARSTPIARSSAWVAGRV